MREAMTPPPTEIADLKVSDKVSIINALMAQDRAEIRERQGDIFKLTYYVVPALLGITAFAVEKPQYKSVLLLGQVLIVALYAVAFFTLRRWLTDARAYQHIRESFYMNPALLQSDPFQPIRPLSDDDRDKGFKDKALSFPFGLTVAIACVLLAYMLVFIP